MKNTGFDGFLLGYMVAALWSSTFDPTGENSGSNEEEIDSNHGIDDIDDDLRAHMTDDCKVFWRRNGCYIDACSERHTSGEYTIEEQAGHDFWLTRNGHGAGFWDRKELWGEYYMERFTKDSKWFGTHDITVHKGKVTNM